MSIVFNILVIGLIALIAYWWANQGFFSALLHLLCVIVAGAISLAVWEPLTSAFLLKGGFANFGWGVSLVGVFFLTLLILRVTFDRLIPGNVDLPDSVNLIGGGVLGAGAGVLTIGIALIGCGMIQSSSTIFGMSLYGRNTKGQIVTRDALWVPAHKLASDFYSYLSVGSLRTSTPMAHYYPQLYRQTSQLRDGFVNTKEQLTGRVSAPPDSISVANVFAVNAGRDQYFSVELHFDKSAFDGGQGLTMSPSQVQLIGSATGNATAPVAFPVRWTQDTEADGVQTFTFDHSGHFVTNVPGRETAEAILHFPRGGNGLPANSSPRFIIVKGNRYALPTNILESNGYPRPARSAAVLDIVVDTNAPMIQDRKQILVSNTIAPVRTSRNEVRFIDVDRDGFLTEGMQDFKRGNTVIARALRINGIAEKTGEVVVQVYVDRESTANIFDPQVHDDLTGDLLDAELRLVDVNGNSFSAIGFIHEFKGTTRIKLDAIKRIDFGDIESLAPVPSSGGAKLRLVFRITEGTQLAALLLDDVTVARMSVLATKDQ